MVCVTFAYFSATSSRAVHSIAQIHMFVELRKKRSRKKKIENEIEKTAPVLSFCADFVKHAAEADAEPFVVLAFVAVSLHDLISDNFYFSFFFNCCCWLHWNFFFVRYESALNCNLSSFALRVCSLLLICCNLSSVDSCTHISSAVGSWELSREMIQFIWHTLYDHIIGDCLINFSSPNTQVNVSVCKNNYPSIPSSSSDSLEKTQSLSRLTTMPA